MPLITSTAIVVPGSVPGGVYSDLLKAGVLGNGSLFYRYNDVAYRWVALENWTYFTTLQGRIGLSIW